MVKKKGQKSAQSKKKLDLAAAVEAAEQGEEESDLSKLNLDADDLDTASAAKKENGNMNDDDTDTGNDDNEEEEEEAVVMNYNPPEEGPVTEQTGKIIIFVFTMVEHVTKEITGFSVLWCNPRLNTTVHMRQSNMFFNLNINLR